MKAKNKILPTTECKLQNQKIIQLLNRIFLKTIIMFLIRSRSNNRTFSRILNTVQFRAPKRLSIKEFNQTRSKGVYKIRTDRGLILILFRITNRIKEIPTRTKKGTSFWASPQLLILMQILLTQARTTIAMQSH